MTTEAFDAIETHAVVALGDDGEVLPRDVAVKRGFIAFDSAAEDEPRANIFAWAVYGHINGRGLRSIADCATPEDAELVATALCQRLNLPRIP